MRRCLGRRNPSRTLGPLVSGLALVGAVYAFGPAVGQAGPILRPETVPDVGRHAVDVAIPEFGRYALFAESERGVSVQVVDRAAGPGDVVGVVGERDGRVDAFFDRGDVRVIVRGLPDDTAASPGTVRVRAEPFREIGAEATRLAELAFVETTLADLEMRTWWIEVGRSRRVVLEAAGRHLADLRLWRDGTWLVAGEPTVDVVEPSEGRPLRRFRLSIQLEPGLYALRAYGGEGVPWAIDEAGEPSAPMVLRSGIPRLGEAGRRRIELSAFGEDSFLVPGTATFFRVETGVDGPAGEAVELRVDDHDTDAPFAGRATQVATIVKETNPPAVELDRGLDVGQLRRVSVRGRAGETVVLQYFLSRSVYHFSESGRHWLSTVSSGAPGDALDTTAILIRNQQARGHRRAMQVRAVDLVDGLEWRRRFNLLGTATLHLQVVDAGTYAIRTSGEATVGLRLEPFAVPGTRPDTYRPPDFREGTGEWQLDPGLYELTLEPRRQGIAELWIRDPAPPDGLPPRPAPPVRADVRFGILDLDRDDSYTLYLNQRPGVRTGIVLRPAPLDLHQPLPLVLDGAEAVTLVARGDAGEVVARAEDGRSEVIMPSADGSFRVTLPEGVDGPAAVSVERVRPAWRGELSTLPAGRFDALPEWPRLVAGTPLHFDAERRRTRTVHVEAEQPGLYHLESTGLLDLAGDLRTRTNPTLESRSDGGTGRNFSIRRYLLPGDYQLSVRPEGESAGRFGLRLARSEARDGGVLTGGVPARGWLDPGEAVAYTLEVDRPGRYRLRSLGLSGPFSVRLEDADGWPLLRPGFSGDLTRFLDSGTYRWIVLPRSVRARQVTVAERLPEPVERAGHGPHTLPLGETVTHRWREPTDGGGERAPDVWTFTLAAPATVSATLSPEMSAELVRLDAAGDAARVAELTPRRGFGGRLDAGEYALRARAARRDDRREYTLRVATSELLPGEVRDVAAPGETTLSTGEDGLYEITTLGGLDVRAGLFDEAGRQVAAGDDRPGDWNVRLARRLAPGRYRLRLDVLGGQGTTRLGLRRLKEIVAPRVELSEGDPVERTATLGDGARRFPVTIPERGDVVLITAESTEAVRLTALVGDAVAGVGEGRSTTLVVPVAAPPIPPAGAPGRVRQLDVRLESLDTTGQPARLRILAIDLDAVSETRAGRLASRPPAGFDVTPVAVDLDRVGCFVVSGARVSTRLGVAAADATAAISAPRRLWLAVGASGARLERLRLGAGEALRLAVPAGETAVCDVGPVDPAWSASGLLGRRVVVAHGLGAPAAVHASPDDDSWGFWGNGTRDDSATPVSFSGRAVSGDASAAFGQASQVVVRVPDAPSGTPMEVDLEAGPVVEVTRHAVDFGAVSLPVEPGGAVFVEVPAIGPMLATVDLSRGLLMTDDEAAHWAEGAALRVVTRSVGGFLVADVAGEGGRFDAVIVPDVASSVPASGALVERRATSHGRIDRGEVSWTRPALTLGVRDLWIVGDDGSLGRGVDAADVGRLVVEHDPGPVLVWPYDPADPLAGFWSGDAPVAEPLDVPAILPLDGSGRRFTLDVETPRVLRLRMPGPAMVGVERPGLDPVLDAFADTVALDLHVPVGRSRIDLRAIAGGTLGQLVSSTTEVADLGEGLGPEVLLGPGEARAFTVGVTGTTRRVGFGVAAESDLVDGRLVDPGGRELGRGKVQWHELEPGAYLFVLELGADSEPVRARPAVVGLDRPGTGPPSEVVEEYLRRAMNAGASEAGR